MKAVFDQCPQTFLKNMAFLYEDEPTNSLMLGLCEGMLTNEPKIPPVLLRVEDDGKSVAGAIQTPPMNLVLTSGSDEQLKLMAAALKQENILFPGVVGPDKSATNFARIWEQIANQKSSLGMAQKIYRLDKVHMPASLDGQMRLATDEDAELVARWLVEFAGESLPPNERKSLEHFRETAKRVIGKNYVYLWTLNDQAVAMTHVGRPTKNGISVSGVYTPPHLRKRGYASSLVAHVSQKMLNLGKTFCVLYTDLSNPTSNKIYQKVGYREVRRSNHYLFEPII